MNKLRLETQSDASADVFHTNSSNVNAAGNTNVVDITNYSNTDGKEIEIPPEKRKNTPNTDRKSK